MTIAILANRLCVSWPTGLHLVLLVDDLGTYAEWYAGDGLDGGWPAEIGEC